MNSLLWVGGGVRGECSHGLPENTLLQEGVITFAAEFMLISPQSQQQRLPWLLQS